MKVLVFGGSGLLGKYVCEVLCEGGAKVYACVHHMDNQWVPSGIEKIKMDVTTNFKHFLQHKGVDIVYYLAQSSLFRDFPAGIKDMYGVNIHGLYNALKWSSEHGVKKFIYASTGGLYPQTTHAGSQEDDVIPLNRPLNFYLYSKTCGEALTQGFAPLFQSVVICRPFFIYGPGQKKNMLIERLIESARSKKPIILAGLEGLLFNPIYVEDAAYAFARASELTGHRIFNIAGPEVVSLKKVGDIIGMLVGVEPLFKVLEEKEPENFAADIRQMCNYLYTPIIGVEEGLKRTIFTEKNRG